MGKYCHHSVVITHNCKVLTKLWRNLHFIFFISNQNNSHLHFNIMLINTQNINTVRLFIVSKGFCLKICIHIYHFCIKHVTFKHGLNSSALKKAFSLMCIRLLDLTLVHISYSWNTLFLLVTLYEVRTNHMFWLESQFCFKQLILLQAVKVTFTLQTTDMLFYLVLYAGFRGIAL